MKKEVKIKRVLISSIYNDMHSNNRKVTMVTMPPEPKKTATQPPKNIPESDRVAVRFCLTWLGLPATMKEYRNLDPRVNWQELYHNLQNPSFDVSMRVPGGCLVAKEIRASDRAAARQVVERDYPKYEFVEWLR